jgi:hypothetical protein
MDRGYRAARKKLFWTYFTWPKVAGTVLVFSLLLLAMRFFDPLALVIGGDVLLVGIYVFEMLVIGKLSRMVKNQSKPLLLTQTIREQSWFGSVVALLLLPNPV